MLDTNYLSLDINYLTLSNYYLTLGINYLTLGNIYLNSACIGECVDYRILLVNRCETAGL